MSKRNNAAQKRTYLPQAEIPRFSLEKALDIAKALRNEFAGKSAEPHQIALALRLSPTSGHWRNLCGASIAYGLTKGGCNAKQIFLTPVGKSIVAPEYEGEDEQAIIDAVLQPKIMRTFFEKYNKAKFPSTNIACNVLLSLDVPMERTNQVLELLIENGRYAKIIQDTKTGPFVAIPSTSAKPVEKSSSATGIDSPEIIDEDGLEDFARQVSAEPQPNLKEIQQTQIKNNRVFISHGKNKVWKI